MDEEKVIWEASTWEAFRKAGMLWFVNRILHVFGWALAIQEVDNELVKIYPVRTNVLGFDEAIDEKHRKRVLSSIINDDITNIIKEK